MCRHNDEDDYNCEQCCVDHGESDFLDGEPYNNPYKNIIQSDAYTGGYRNMEYLMDLKSIVDKVAKSEKITTNSECGSIENPIDSGS